jgi:NhaP-type Na+/H+ and K+/H+ antiporter
MRDISDFYGLTIEAHEFDQTLSQWTRLRLGKPAVIGDQVHAGGLCFTVTALDGEGNIQRVGVKGDEAAS